MAEVEATRDPRRRLAEVAGMVRQLGKPNDQDGRDALAYLVETRTDLILHLRRRGMTLQEIVRLSGMSLGYVATLCRDNGLGRYTQQRVPA